MRSSRSGSPGAFSAILPNIQLLSTSFERSKQRQDGARAGESEISNLPGATKFLVVGSPVHNTHPLLDERLQTFLVFYYRYECSYLWPSPLDLEIVDKLPSIPTGDFADALKAPEDLVLLRLMRHSARGCQE